MLYTEEKEPNTIIIYSSSKFGQFMKTMVKVGKNKGKLTLKDGSCRTFYYVRQEEKNGEILYYIDVI